MLSTREAAAITHRWRTYEHMLWEFEIAYPFLRLGELLFADDALWNSAFEDFARKVGTPEARILHGVGVLRKNGA